ncbi:MAG: zinc ribbon domain-containing protein [Promethearchaeota archaeon]|nr:MAG: zinc ribbon domain-containing protein [Candidatus Lokiarchaeota archaeon]
MKVIEVFRSRLVLFIIQTLILNLVVFYFGYQVNLNYDIGIQIEQKMIIQFLANYIWFNKLSGLFFIYILWIIILFIPVIIYNNFKKAYSMNLITFFFPNFFLYIFLSRYSPIYFNSHFGFHFVNTILLAMLIVSLSISFSLIKEKILKSKSKPQIEDLHSIANEIKKVCPKCGTEFNSLPKFCYNCNTNLTEIIEDKTG